MSFKNIVQSALIAICTFSVVIPQGFSVGREFTQPLPPLGPIELRPSEKLITILGTNDIHGALEHNTSSSTGEPVGGLAILSGIFAATKAGLQKRFGEDRAGTLLVDAGDQFQGTLLSNYNEGALVFGSMNEMEYDAVIPGNHDYDFGPLGWLVDQDPSGRPNRGALLNLAANAKFPLLSANTYYRRSLVNVVGQPIPVVSPIGCKPASGEQVLWNRAVRPEFLRPYVIKEVAGVKVAIIGIDNMSTTRDTVEANVSDLCFRDEAQSYYEVRASLQGQADIFVMLVHNGNTNDDFPVSYIAAELNSWAKPEMPNVVDVIVAGHTHYVNNHSAARIPIVQAGANARAYSRIDIIWDTTTNRVNKDRSQARGGIPATYQSCPQGVPFCQRSQVPGQILIEGLPVVPNQPIWTEIEKEKRRINPLASQPLTQSQKLISADRVNESPLGNLIADHLREMADSQIAIINAGGLRTSLPAGGIFYGHLFQVMPFNGYALQMNPMELSALATIFTLAAKTCGEYDAVMQSGLTIEYERKCVRTERAAEGVDPNGRVVNMMFNATKEVLMKDGAIVGDPHRKFSVATNSFLAGGGSGYFPFAAAGAVKNYGILREWLAKYWQTKYLTGVTSGIDGRWKNIKVQ